MNAGYSLHYRPILHEAVMKEFNKCLTTIAFKLFVQQILNDEIKFESTFSTLWV